jgi:hypothetical protein
LIYYSIIRFLKVNYSIWGNYQYLPFDSWGFFMRKEHASKYWRDGGDDETHFVKDLVGFSEKSSGKCKM